MSMDSQVLSAPGDHGCDGEEPLFQLTPMQRKILDGVSSGQLNKQIAYDLGIAETTVKAHMTTIMRKLNVRNRTQVALAVQAMKQVAVSAAR
jgi:DNA-binding NarL/FixJ family response regulator